MTRRPAAPVPSKPEQMLTTREVAALVRLSPYTVRVHAADGRLPGAVKVGHDWRFRESVIAAFLAGAA